MYTRNYQSDEKDSLKIPEGYDGIAFRDNDSEKNDLLSETGDAALHLKAPWDEKKEQPQAAEPVMASPRRNDGFLSGLLGKFNIGGLFDCGGFFKDGHLSLGTEEILIIGIALLLLFNKSGDKECAIMLLLLLFIK